MPPIAILTPDPADASFASVWPGVLDRLRDALALGGFDVEPAPWTAHVDDVEGLRRYALVLPLLAWGYHAEPLRWLRACAAWARAGIPVANAPSVLAWNSDKRYLARLAERGIAIPPTTWTRSPTQAQVDALFDATGAAQLIVKPTVSAGAWKTLRVARGQAVADAPTGDAMIQPFLATIETEGETSLLYFGGVLSHAVNKRPVPGEFRIQSQYGGTYRVLEAPPPGALALARRTLDAIDDALLYARIDMVPDEAGHWMLMEVELIEPDFYLGVDPRRGAGFADALHALLARRPGHGER